MTAGLRSLFGDPLLRILVPCLWVLVLVGEAMNIVEVFLITDEIGLDAAGYGWVLAAQGGGAIVGAWVTGRLTTGISQSRAVLGGMAAIGASAVLMGLAGNVVTVVAGAIVCGFGGGMLNAGTSTLVVTRSAEAVRGRVNAALMGTVRGCSLVALLLGGLLGAVLGARSTFVTCGVACAVAAVAASFLVVRTKDSAVEVLSH
jgi:MFS family permease